MGTSALKKHISLLLPSIALMVSIGSLAFNLRSSHVIVVSYVFTMIVIVSYMVLIVKATSILINTCVDESSLNSLLSTKVMRSLLVYFILLLAANAIGYFFISSFVSFLFAAMFFSNSCRNESDLVMQISLEKAGNPLMLSLILGSNDQCQSAYSAFDHDSTINSANGQAMTGYTDSSGCLPGCGTPSWPADTYTSNPSNRYD